jgi:hypothetical protein
VEPNTINTVVPIRDRNGSVIAEAIVDPEDHERISAHRWCLHHRGSPVRGVRRNGRVEHLSMQRAVLGLPPYGGPRVLHRNGNQLDNRRANLTVSSSWLAARILSHPHLREVAHTMFVPGWTPAGGHATGVPSDPTRGEDSDG